MVNHSALFLLRKKLQNLLDKYKKIMYTNCTSTHSTVERGEEMIKLDYMDSRSLHEQIKDGIKSLIINKILSENEQLPSVRELSISLTVNPNTVQKAYKELESEGFIYSVKGRGNFVSEASCVKDDEKISELYKSLEETLKALIYLGESNEEIDAAIYRIKEELK